MRKLLDLESDFLCEGHAGIYRGEEIREYIEGYLRKMAEDIGIVQGNCEKV
jgi:hypothetical protein